MTAGKMPAEGFSLGIDAERTPRNYRIWLLWLVPLAMSVGARAQTCQSGADMATPARTAIEAAANRYFEMSAHGDIAGLKQNSIAAVGANFAGIEQAVKDNQAAFADAKATLRPSFLLTADGTESMARAEFLCGVFGPSGQTKDSAVFVLNNLPAGKYAVTSADVSGDKGVRTLTLILQQVGNDWKLAGFYARPSQTAGHDSAWFAQRAREFKAKSQNHDAWLYYREAIALAAPVDFMSTQLTDKLYDESQATQPADMPANGKTIDMSAGGKVYHLTEMFPLAAGNDLDVVVKYQATDISDTAHTFQENSVVIKALVARFPELREAFAGVVARAVDSSGHDYGTLLAMKDVK